VYLLSVKHYEGLLQALEDAQNAKEEANGVLADTSPPTVASAIFKFWYFLKTCGLVNQFKLVRILEHESFHGSSPMYYSPAYALKPPSTGVVVPVTYVEALEAYQMAVPASSAGSPKRPMGVWLMMA